MIPLSGPALRLVTATLEGHPVTLDEVRGRSSSTSIARARKACYFALSEYGYSSVEIGALMGRHSSSVLAGLGRRTRNQGTPAQFVSCPGEIRGCAP